MKMSKTSALRLLKQVKATKIKPIFNEKNQSYEIEELRNCFEFCE